MRKLIYLVIVCCVLTSCTSERTEGQGSADSTKTSSQPGGPTPAEPANNGIEIKSVDDATSKQTEYINAVRALGAEAFSNGYFLQSSTLNGILALHKNVLLIHGIKDDRPCFVLVPADDNFAPKFNLAGDAYFFQGATGLCPEVCDIGGTTVVIGKVESLATVRPFLQNYIAFYGEGSLNAIKLQSSLIGLRNVLANKFIRIIAIGPPLEYHSFGVTGARSVDDITQHGKQDATNFVNVPIP